MKSLSFVLCLAFCVLNLVPAIMVALKLMEPTPGVDYFAQSIAWAAAAGIFRGDG